MKKLQAKVFFIASTGGHLRQLLALSPMFSKYDSYIFTEKTKSTIGLKKTYAKRMHYFIFGSKVHLFSYMFKFSYNILLSLYYFIRYSPDFVITTGTHTAVPMCYIAHFFKKKVIYVETRSSFNKITKAGQLVYKIADLFVIQRKSLQTLVPKAVLCEVEE